MNTLIILVKKTIQGLLALRKNNVVKNLFLVGGISLIIKGIGFYKETLVAGSFGLSEVLDTFFIATLIPGFISAVFLGSFQSVFIPNYIAESKSGGNIASFQATGFVVTSIISLLFMFGALLVTDVYLDFFFPNHTQAYYQLVKGQFYYLLPCIVFWGFSSLIGGLLYINNEYRLSSFSNIFVPIVIIIFLLFFKDIFGNHVLAIGTLVGSIISFLYVLTLALQKNILKISTPNLQNANAKLMFKQVPAKISSSVATGLNRVVDQFFAAQLIIGSIAAINYGLKIPAFITGLLVISLSGVLLPHFSKSILENREKTFRTLFKILRTIFLGVLVLVIVGILFSEPLVKLLFERKAFTPENTALVASIQKAFLIYLPFSISGMVMVNFLTSVNKNAIMAYISIAALIVNTILDYILMQYYGVVGIAICTTIVVIAKNIAMFLYILRLRSAEKVTVGL